MDDLDPQLLRVLRAVADVGSISGAAVRLGSSQPAVSQLLQRAETRLGHALVLRGTRGATLTEAGTVLAAHAVHVQAALTAASEDLAALGGLARGRVRLAGFPSASSAIVPTVLATLARTAPGLTTSYVEAEPPEALELLRQGEVDVAVTFTYVGDEALGTDDAALLVRPIGVDPLALVTPVAVGSAHGDDVAGSALPGGPVPVGVRSPVIDTAGSAVPGGPMRAAARGPVDGTARTAPVTASPATSVPQVVVPGARPLGIVPPGPLPGSVDLAQYRDARWIGGCPRCRGHLLASCRTAGFTPEIVLETDNAAAVVGLVAAGLGVALLPRLALATTVIPPGVSVDPVSDDLGRRVEVVVARGADRVPSVRAVLDAVRASAHVLG